eukprot:79154-Pelagomonas_calceolata.AAC.1
MPVCVCMQSRDQAINLAVALALFFVLLGIPWHSAASFEDDMFWDNTAANQFCHSCRIKLYCHAYLVSARVLSSLVQCEDTQTCSYFCHFCNHGNLERKHDHEKLCTKRLPNSPFDYLHPLQRNEWLSELAKTQPRVSRPHTQTAMKQSVEGWRESINDIISYCKNPHTLVDTQYTSSSILKVLLAKGSPTSDHPQLHPYDLPNKKNFLNSLMRELRSPEAIINAQRLVSDRTSTTILLFSPSGVQTPFHFDWTEAKNLALEIEGKTNPEMAAAVWYFVKFAFEKVPRGCNLGQEVFCQGHCEDFMSKHPGCMLRLEQKVGEIMHVPPGWLHADFTMQASVKMAWDFIEPTSFAHYMAAWMHVGTHMHHTADDYMGITAVLVEHALHN